MKPNEWFTLRRAARHLAQGFAKECWAVDADWWSFYEAVRLLQWAAAQIPDKCDCRRKSMFWF